MMLNVYILVILVVVMMMHEALFVVFVDFVDFVLTHADTAYVAAVWNVVYL